MPRSAHRLLLEVLEDRNVLSGTLPSGAPDEVLSLAWTPNDPMFSQQWGMANKSTPGADINAPLAWGYTIGLRRTTVSVMDTGIDYTHPDLYKNIWINQKEIPTTRRVNLIDIGTPLTLSSTKVHRASTAFHNHGMKGR